MPDDEADRARWIDKLEIRELIERSVRHIDDQDSAALAALFEDDGVLQLAGTVFAGREALLGHVPRGRGATGSGPNPGGCSCSPAACTSPATR